MRNVTLVSKLEEAEGDREPRTVVAGGGEGTKSVPRASSGKKDLLTSSATDFRLLTSQAGRELSVLF